MAIKNKTVFNIKTVDDGNFNVTNSGSYNDNPTPSYSHFINITSLGVTVVKKDGTTDLLVEKDSNDNSYKEFVNLLFLATYGTDYNIKGPVFYTNEDKFENRLGYSNRHDLFRVLVEENFRPIYYYEKHKFMLSVALYHNNDRHEIGEIVGIGIKNFFVVRKMQNCYDFVRQILTYKQLRQYFPSLKKIIQINHSINAASSFFAAFKVKNIALNETHLTHYMWDKLNGGNYNGYNVRMKVEADFLICFKKQKYEIKAEDEYIPFQTTAEYNVGDVTSIEIYIVINFKSELVKQFNLVKKKRRIISITIVVNEDGIPKVNLKEM